MIIFTLRTRGEGHSVSPCVGKDATQRAMAIPGKLCVAGSCGWHRTNVKELRTLGDLALDKMMTPRSDRHRKQARNG